MDQEDGVIWVYGPGDDTVMTFTDFGIETITGIVEIYKANPSRSSGQRIQTKPATAYDVWLR